MGRAATITTTFHRRVASVRTSRVRALPIGSVDCSGGVDPAVKFPRRDKDATTNADEPQVVRNMPIEEVSADTEHRCRFVDRHGQAAFHRHLAIARHGRIG